MRSKKIRYDRSGHFRSVPRADIKSLLISFSPNKIEHKATNNFPWRRQPRAHHVKEIFNAVCIIRRTATCGNFSLNFSHISHTKVHLRKRWLWLSSVSLHKSSSSVMWSPTSLNNPECKFFVEPPSKRRKSILALFSLTKQNYSMENSTPILKGCCRLLW